MERGQVICDTNILVDFFDRTGIRKQKAAYYLGEIGMGNVLISAITEMELVKGIRDKEHAGQMVKKLRGISTVPVDPDMSARATALHYTHHLGYGLDIADALVAATALETGLPLFTYNTRDFHFIDGLQLYAP